MGIPVEASGRQDVAADDVRRFTLDEGDILVVRVPGHFSIGQHAELKRRIELMLPEAKRVLILEGGVSIDSIIKVGSDGSVSL